MTLSVAALLAAALRLWTPLAFAALGGADQILNVEDPGIAAYDPQSGRQLWRHPWPDGWRGHPKVSQPLVLPGDRQGRPLRFEAKW